MLLPLVGTHPTRIRIINNNNGIVDARLLRKFRVRLPLHLPLCLHPHQVRLLHLRHLHRPLVVLHLHLLHGLLLLHRKETTLNAFAVRCARSSARSLDATPEDPPNPSTTRKRKKIKKGRKRRGKFSSLERSTKYFRRRSFWGSSCTCAIPTSAALRRCAGCGSKSCRPIPCGRDCSKPSSARDAFPSPSSKARPSTHRRRHRHRQRQRLRQRVCNRNRGTAVRGI